MRSVSVRLLFLMALTISLMAACNAAAPQEPDDGRLRVVSTVSPITNVIYNIGGDKIQLHGIVPEGTNSHTFEPAPSDAIALSQADLIFLNGLQLEQPSLELARANQKEGSEIVLLGELTISPDEYVYDFSFPKEAGSPNPHLWTNPAHMQSYAAIIRDKLIERDPDNEPYYAGNFQALSEKLTALDAAIRVTTATIPEGDRKLLTYHDSFAYFAPTYGYTVIGAIQPSGFSEPSAKEVASLIEQIRAENVPAIFGSEVFPSSVLAQIGREADVRYVDELRDDDLPGEVGDDDHSYIGLMTANLKIMADALGGDPTQMDSVDTRNIPGPDTAVIQQQ